MSAAGSPPPDPTTGRFRAFYDKADPIEFDVEWPDDINGPEDQAEFVFDHAPIVEQRAVFVEPVSPEAAVLPPAGSVSARTPVPEGSTTREASDGDLRAELAVWIAHPQMPRSRAAFQPERCTACAAGAVTADDMIAAGYRRQADPDVSLVDLILADYPTMAHRLMWVHAEEMAAAIQAAGWVRVADDDATRRLLAAALASVEHWHPGWSKTSVPLGQFRVQVDAVLAALRGGEQGG